VCQIRMTRKGEELPTAVLACRSALPAKAHLAAVAQRLNLKTRLASEDYHGGRPSQDHAVTASDGRKGLARTIALDGGSLTLLAIWNRPASKASAMAVLESLRREGSAPVARPRLTSSGGIGFSAYDPGSGAGTSRAPVVTVTNTGGAPAPAAQGQPAAPGKGGALDAVRYGATAPPAVSTANAGLGTDGVAVPPQIEGLLKSLPQGTGGR
jgi:hypothetical protein